MTSTKFARIFFLLNFLLPSVLAHKFLEKKRGRLWDRYLGSLGDAEWDLLLTPVRVRWRNRDTGPVAYRIRRLNAWRRGRENRSRGRHDIRGHQAYERIGKLVPEPRRESFLEGVPRPKPRSISKSQSESTFLEVSSSPPEPRGSARGRRGDMIVEREEYLHSSSRSGDNDSPLGLASSQQHSSRRSSSGFSEEADADEFFLPRYSPFPSSSPNAHWERHRRTRLTPLPMPSSFFGMVPLAALAGPMIAGPLMGMVGGAMGGGGGGGGTKTPGLPGKPGLMGKEGTDGISGVPGDPGKLGEAGVPGHAGDTGKQGQEGELGKKGHKGAPGAAGPHGATGLPGGKGVEVGILHVGGRSSSCWRKNRNISRGNEWSVAVRVSRGRGVVAADSGGGGNMSA